MPGSQFHVGTKRKKLCTIPLRGVHTKSEVLKVVQQMPLTPTPMPNPAVPSDATAHLTSLPPHQPYLRQLELTPGMSRLAQHNGPRSVLQTRLRPWHTESVPSRPFATVRSAYVVKIAVGCHVNRHVELLAQLMTDVVTGAPYILG
jgi:hypothetical protein